MKGWDKYLSLLIFSKGCNGMLYTIVRFLKVMFETSITYSMSLIICDFLQLHICLTHNSNGHRPLTLGEPDHNATHCGISGYTIIGWKKFFMQKYLISFHEACNWGRYVFYVKQITFSINHKFIIVRHGVNKGFEI